MEVALDTSQPRLRPLVDASISGDRDAFRMLVEPSIRGALSLATIVTGSPADGADAVQDALLSAWRGLSGLRDADAFPAWFRRHVVRASMRTASRRGRVLELDVDQPDAPDALERAVAQRTLARAFDRLRPDDRLLLTLHHYLGLPVAETAGHLGIPTGTVKSRVHAAMDRLRAAYDAEERR
jgi:RNA polymerase sigma-70 factor (ECF subfamily)